MRKLNEGFTCRGCGAVVLPAHKTTRNHCPQCFFSSHVDGKIPGDRDSTCGGVMLPIEYLIKHGKEKIKFECVVCGKQHINKTASDDALGNIHHYIALYRKEFKINVQ